ncbi:hypothetical protein SI65_05549 [Aspergillus cristatus]|uniref:Uncharacterized protein n=1 Tax=Aspergillus cristatus TaxID=573508 RepID=A0A1E3BD84_ASPCR|nr:hypothetical protein SI65_05549 [Aspergillus cristatus]
MRIKGRKSKVDRRQPQRGGRFTSAQLAWMDRDQERLHRAREKERRRIANKKRQAEKEAKEREERRKQGIPDPHAMPVPSSQPLLSKFLVKPKTAPPLESPSVERPEFGDDDFEGRSDSGDTEVCSLDSYEAEIEAFDQRVLADEIAAEREGRQWMVELTPALDRIRKHGPTVDGRCNNIEKEEQDGPKDDDEDAFSECSAFYDENFIRKAETVAIAQGQGPQKTSQSLEAQPPQGQPAQPGVVEAYREAKPAQPQPQPQPITRPPAKPAIEESFRDDTADFLEQFGCNLGADGEFAPDEDFERELVQLNAG